MLAALPVAFNFQPTWGNTLGTTLQRQCGELMMHLPLDGTFTPTQPRILSFGECFVGIYVTAPLARRTVPVSDDWSVIYTWMLGAMLLYAGAVPAGWSLNLHSGIQICMWHSQLLNLAQERPMPSTLRSTTGSLASGLTNLAQDRGASGAAFTALLVGMRAQSPLDAPTGVAHMVFGWAAHPGMPLEDCRLLLRTFHVTDWFLRAGGVFLRVPVVMRYRGCGFSMFFSVPPADGRGRLAAPAGDPGVVHDTWRLMTETTHRGNVVGGYMDLSNGLQVVLYDAQVADPRFLCSLITKISVKQCLENNLAASMRYGGPGSSNIAAGWNVAPSNPLAGLASTSKSLVGPAPTR